MFIWKVCLYIKMYFERYITYIVIIYMLWNMEKYVIFLIYYVSMKCDILHGSKDISAISCTINIILNII